MISPYIGQNLPFDQIIISVDNEHWNGVGTLHTYKVRVPCSPVAPLESKAVAIILPIPYH